jgi:hypothetical protein
VGLEVVEAEFAVLSEVVFLGAGKKTVDGGEEEDEELDDDEGEEMGESTEDEARVGSLLFVDISLISGVVIVAVDVVESDVGVSVLFVTEGPIFVVITYLVICCGWATVGRMEQILANFGGDPKVVADVFGMIIGVVVVSRFDGVSSCGLVRIVPLLSRLIDGAAPDVGLTFRL